MARADTISLFPRWNISAQERENEEMPTNTPTTAQPWGDFQSAFCHLLNPEPAFLTVGNESLSALRELSQQESFLSQKSDDSDAFTCPHPWHQPLFSLMEHFFGKAEPGQAALICAQWALQ